MFNRINSRLSYTLAIKRRYTLLKLLGRLKLLWWAICGRPIIHKVIFDGGFSLDKSNRNVLILNNIVRKREQ